MNSHSIKVCKKLGQTWHRKKEIDVWYITGRLILHKNVTPCSKNNIHYFVTEMLLKMLLFCTGCWANALSMWFSLVNLSGLIIIRPSQLVFSIMNYIICLYNEFPTNKELSFAIQSV
jgi:hypothetical protein